MQKTQTKELVLTALFTAIIILMAFTSLGYIPLVIINATIIHIPVILGSLFCGPKKGGFLGFVFGFTSFINNTFRSTSLSAFVFSPVISASMFGASGIVKSILICFVPRILVGVLPYFVYRLIQKAMVSTNKKTTTTLLNALVSLFLFVGVRAFILKMIEGANAGIVTIIALVIAVVLFVLLYLGTAKKESNVLPFTYAGVAGAMTNTLLVMGGIYVLYKDAYAEATSVSADAVLGVIGGVISFNGVIEAIVAAIIVAALGSVLVKIQPIYEAK